MIRNLQVRTSSLLSIFKGHPEVDSVSLLKSDSESVACFDQLSDPQSIWHRKIGQSDNGIFLDLEDNNPLVCADEVQILPSVKAAQAVLFGPLLKAGIPYIASQIDSHKNPDLSLSLTEESWTIQCSLNVAEFRELYLHYFGRSYLVQLDSHSKLQNPFKLTISPDEDKLILQLQRQSEIFISNFLCIHAFNVMCGFQDLLGIQNSDLDDF